MGLVDFIELLHEDLAPAFPTAFDLACRDENPLDRLDTESAETLLSEAAAASYPDTQSFLRQAAQGLGLPTGGTLSDFPKVQAFQRVIELPGAGGRIAAQQVLSHSDLSFDRQFLFVADTDAERVLIGLAALELRSNAPEVINCSLLDEKLRSDARLDKAYGIANWRGADLAIAAVRKSGKDVRCI
jgi:hypothetical protein